VKDLVAMGSKSKRGHHEVAAGQHEIDFRYAEAARDGRQPRHVPIRGAERRVRHGFLATFMPKPIFGQNGSGMHTHPVAVSERGARVQIQGEMELSSVALQYIAGLLEHAAASARSRIHS